MSTCECSPGFSPFTITLSPRKICCPLLQTEGIAIGMQVNHQALHLPGNVSFREHWGVGTESQCSKALHCIAHRTVAATQGRWQSFLYCFALR